VSKPRTTSDAPRNDTIKAQVSAPDEITFYRSEDLLLGLCGNWGVEGIYRLFLGTEGSWEFSPHETKAWDWYHQLVLRKGDATPCDPWALDEPVPPMPETHPPPERFIVRDAPEPEAPHATRGSRVFERVAAQPQGRLRVHVVLYEDRYESLFGDGVFRDFSAAFFGEKAAKSYIRRKTQAVNRESQQLMEFHIRTVELEVRGDVLVLDKETAALSPFDHFTLQQVTNNLAEARSG
jgi:hypothetical protein